MKQPAGIPLNQLMARLLKTKPKKPEPLTRNYQEARQSARKAHAR